MTTLFLTKANASVLKLHLKIAIFIQATFKPMEYMDLFNFIVCALLQLPILNQMWFDLKLFSPGTNIMPQMLFESRTI